MSFQATKRDALTQANIQRLVGVHVTRYKDHIREKLIGDNPCISLVVCLEKLALWRGVYQKDCQWKVLNQVEREAILAAIQAQE